METSGWLPLVLVREHQHRPGGWSANTVCCNAENGNCIKLNLQLFFFFYPVGRISWSCFTLKASLPPFCCVAENILFIKKDNGSNIVSCGKEWLILPQDTKGVCWLKQGGKKRNFSGIFEYCGGRGTCELEVHKAPLVNKVRAKTNITAVNFLAHKQRKEIELAFIWL